MDELIEEVITADEPSDEFRSIWTDLRGVAFQQGWLDVNGVNIRYLRSGDPGAPKVVMLAGTGGHAETFAANLGPLGQQFDCWAIDIPGCGYSDKPDRSYDAINTAGFVKDLAETIGAAQIDIIGVSVGSWSALQAARLYPDLVRKLILLSPAGGRSPTRRTPGTSSGSSRTCVPPSAPRGMLDSRSPRRPRGRPPRRSSPGSCPIVAAWPTT